MIQFVRKKYEERSADALRIWHQCQVLGVCFELSARRGYGSYEFIKAVMTSEYGKLVMTGKRESEWTDPLFLLSGFEREFGVIKGKVWEDTEELWCTGSLYRHWVAMYDADPEDVWKVAPLGHVGSINPDLYHVAWDTLIPQLTERYNGVNNARI